MDRLGVDVERRRSARAAAGRVGARRDRRLARDRRRSIGALKDADAGVRRQAAWALGVIGK